MAFWCIILIVFAFLSYAIDSGRLSYLIFRHLWNILLLGLGILLVIRVKNKENLGFLEHLEFQINDLYDRIEKKRVETIYKKLDEVDARLKNIEERK
jgi:hypothetical protein